MKRFLPHLTAIGIFVAISAIYFSPVIGPAGKVLSAHDVITWEGMSKEVRDFRKETGKEALWTKRMFSGMPAYQISTQSNGNLIQYVDKVFQLGLPRPLNLLFMYLIGFYILLLTLKIDYKLAIVGAIGFAFSSYFIIILQAGHMTKAHAIAYLPLIIASVLYTFKSKKWLLGAVFTSLFVALQLYSNHYQITYYTVIILFLIGIVQFVKELQDKTLPNFFKKVGILVVAALLGAATNYSRLATTMEYGPETQRGKSELVAEDGKEKNDGLGLEYATRWSYGKMETMTFLIPNFMGGSSSKFDTKTKNSYLLSVFDELNLGKESKTYKYLGKIRNPRKQQELTQQTSSYWGDQPGTSPTYVGAIIFFLFVLGIMYVKSTFRIWILLATILSIMLGWGSNFMSLTEFFFNYVPAYNKFRAVTMAMIIAEFGIALLAILALNKFLNKEDDKEKEKKLKLAFYITGGIALIFGLFPSLFVDFLSNRDSSNNPQFINALALDRESIMKSDAWRSFFFILLAFGTLWMFIKRKVKKRYVVIILGVLILTDMWVIDKRYLNETHFVRKSKSSFVKTEADKSIISQNKDHSRVFNLSNPFNESVTSYYHNSIGGYHAAKLLRYQELIDYHLYPEFEKIRNSSQIVNYRKLKKGMKKLTADYRKKQIDLKKLPNSDGDIQQKLELLKKQYIIGTEQIDLEIKKLQDLWNFSNVLNMLNTKYIIDNPNESPIINQNPLGNAWFVSEVNLVKDANKELDALNSFNPATTAIVDIRFSKQIINNLDNTSANITLEEYKPNYLKYNSNSIKEGIVIFSEIYYKKGWNAYVDGELRPHFRANYVLRGMQIPKGDHIIEFKFEPSTYKIGETISLASSIILLLFLALVSFKELKA